VINLEVRIEPEEPLLFGDNRSARAGLDHTLRDQDPSPATLYGALGALLAGSLGATGKATWDRAAGVLGPFRDRLDQAAPEGSTAELLGWSLADPQDGRWFPRPLHCRLERVGREIFALPPLHPGQSAFLSSLVLPRLLDWDDPPGQTPEEVEETLWVDESLLGDLLAGEHQPSGRRLDASLRGAGDLYRPEVRPGLAMDSAANVAVERRLFSRPYRRFAAGLRASGGGFHSAGFCAWLRVPGLANRAAESFSGPGFLGGDRRRASFAVSQLAERPLAHLCSRVAEAAAARPSAGPFAYLLTPSPAAVPVVLGGLAPVAAATGRPVHASGWDAEAGAPRPMTALVPPGSVYFFEWRQEDPAERRLLIEKAWFGSVAGSMAAAGFGRVLVGLWR
jgi:CRISPR type III-B/RAMP module-associated protein Cmr3